MATPKFADIEIDCSDGVERLGYYRANNCVIFTRMNQDQAFSCYWTPKQPPIEALFKILNLGFITKDGTAAAKVGGEEYYTKHWRESLKWLDARKHSTISFVSFDTATRSVTLEPSADEVPIIMCGMTGELITREEYKHDLRMLCTAFTLTASRELVQQFSVMKVRLFE